MNLQSVVPQRAHVLDRCSFNLLKNESAAANGSVEGTHADLMESPFVENFSSKPCRVDKDLALV